MLSPSHGRRTYICKKKMKKTTLKPINIALVAALLLSIASSIIQECRAGGDLAGISNGVLTLIHIIVTSLLLLLSYLHVRLHFGPVRKWPAIVRKTKMQNRWLLATSVIVLLTGAAATFTYCAAGHTSLGGIHGKLGFAALALMTLHLAHRRKWFRNN